MKKNLRECGEIGDKEDETKRIFSLLNIQSTSGVNATLFSHKFL